MALGSTDQPEHEVDDDEALVDDEDRRDLRQEALERARQDIEQEIYEKERRRTKEPPNAILHERQIVADGLAYGRTVLEIAEEAGLRPDHFSSGVLAATYKALRTCLVRGDVISHAAVCEQLHRQGELEKAGGPLGVERFKEHQTREGILSDAATGYACFNIIDKWQKRNIIEIALNLAVEARGGRTADEIARDGSASLDAAVATTQAGSVIDNLTVAQAAAARAPALGGSRECLSTGFVDIDRALGGGMAPCELHIVAARPSAGKSQYMLDVSSDVALRRKLRVLIFSIEMDGESLFERLAGQRSGVDPRNRHASREERARLSAAYAELGESSLIIDVQKPITIAQVQARARAIHRRHPLALICVDYLQKIKNGTDNDVSDLEMTSTGLKNLACELRLPVLALAQLNRALESRTNKRPQLSDLRGSGAIEQDGDVIAMLYRREQHDKDQTPPHYRGIAELFIEKNRNGPTDADIKLRFDGVPRTFKSLARDHQ